jgi:hypothetical protein
MSTIRLATEDAVELAELLQFVKDWITADDQAKVSFAGFVGTSGYDAADLSSDIDRFIFLLGGDDGEHLLAWPRTGSVQLVNRTESPGPPDRLARTGGLTISVHGAIPRGRSVSGELLRENRRPDRRTARSRGRLPSPRTGPW